MQFIFQVYQLFLQFSHSFFLFLSAKTLAKVTESFAFNVVARNEIALFALMSIWLGNKLPKELIKPREEVGNVSHKA